MVKPLTEELRRNRRSSPHIDSSIAYAVRFSDAVVADRAGR